MRVAPAAANAQHRVANIDFQLVRTDARQIDFHHPAVGALVNVGGRIPETSRGYHSPLAAQQRVITIIVSHGKRISTDYTDVNQCNLRSEEHTSELQSQSNLVCRL